MAHEIPMGIEEEAAQKMHCSNPVQKHRSLNTMRLWCTRKKYDVATRASNKTENIK